MRVKKSSFPVAFSGRICEYFWLVVLNPQNSLQLPFKDLDLVSTFSLDINKFDNTYDRYSGQNNWWWRFVTGYLIFDIVNFFEQGFTIYFLNF